MVKLKSPEQLKKEFEERKKAHQLKKQKEKERYEKARRAVKKALADKLSTANEKCAQKPSIAPQIETYSINIYGNNYIERESAEEDLYCSIEELKEAERRGEGEINWDVWHKLVKKIQNCFS